MAYPGHSADIYKRTRTKPARIEAATTKVETSPRGLAAERRGLCTLLNLKPGSVSTRRRPCRSSRWAGDFSFLRGIRTLGVQEFEVFDTNDLYRGKDMRKVVQCIHSIGTAVKKSGWTGPQLGVKIASPNKRDFSEQQLLEARSATSKLTVGSAGFTERSEVLKEGITFGNDQSGSALNSRQTMGPASTERLEVIDRGITMGADAATRDLE